MNNLDYFLKKYAFYIFLLATFVVMLFRVPFWDETHAFEIASLKLNEIFYLTRIEGHPILWYLILKPFTNIKLYPYSMLFINWIFTSTAVYILFKKAHFSYVVKTLIAYSTPFLLYFAPVARCYGIGILLLFLICTYHPKRFKRPYVYSSLIVFASQTSLTAMIGVFYIGLIYLYELIVRIRKNLIPKKVLISVFFIFLLTALFTISEFAGVKAYSDNNYMQSYYYMCYFMSLFESLNITPFLLRFFCWSAVLGFPYFMFKYSRKALFFIASTFLTMLAVFIFAYPGGYWNFFWFFVWFIVCMWLYGKKQLKIKYIKYNFILILIFMIFPYAVLNTNNFQIVYASNSKKIADYISGKIEYKNAKLYTLDWWSDISPSSDIYLKQKGIKLYNMQNVERGSFEDIKNIFQYWFKVKITDFDEFMLNVPEDFYILTDTRFQFEKFKDCNIKIEKNADINIKTRKRSYLLKAVDITPNKLNLIIYKVIKL